MQEVEVEIEGGGSSVLCNTTHSGGNQCAEEDSADQVARIVYANVDARDDDSETHKRKPDV
jgi:hypothetical protein